MPMMPSATHGPRDAWSTMKPAVGAASQRRNAGQARAFDDTLSQVDGASAATPEAASLPSSGTQMPPEDLSQAGDLETAPLAQETSMTPADATLNVDPTSMSAASAPVAWTGAEAAAYAQQYGTSYPAATEALTTLPPAGPTLASGTGSHGVFDGSVSSQDVASAYADAAGVPETPMQQGFSAVA